MIRCFGDAELARLGRRGLSQSMGLGSARPTWPVLARVAWLGSALPVQAWRMHPPSVLTVAVDTVGSKARRTDLVRKLLCKSLREMMGRLGVA